MLGVTRSSERALVSLGVLSRVSRGGGGVSVLTSLGDGVSSLASSAGVGIVYRTSSTEADT